MATGLQGIGFRNKLLPLFQAGTTIINRNGIFIYSSLPPAAGNLLASLGVVTAGTDRAGNHYVTGDTWYDNARGVATTITGVQMAWLTGSLAAGWPGSIGLLEGLTAPAPGWIEMGGNVDMPQRLVIGTGVLGIGTTDALEVFGAMALRNQGAAPASVANYAQPFSSGGALDVVDSSDGVTYSTERLTQLIAAQSITSLTNLAAFTVSARAYEFEATLLSANVVAADAMDVAFALSGGAVVSTFGLEYVARSIAAGAVTETAAIPTTFTATFTTSNANANRQSLKISGQVTFSAGGTVTLTANEHVALNPVSLFPSKIAFYPIT